MKPYFKLGDWNAICDQCGLQRKGSMLIRRWDGLMVCRPSVQPGCWNPRQPQDYVRGVSDKQTPPWTRPQGEDVFVDTATRPEDIL